MTSPRRMLKTALLAAPLGALALSLPAGSAEAADIVDTLEEQQQFSTLAKVIESAGIGQSLQGEGPYTVFAPTDEAFEKLPEGALDELMKQENQDQLRSLLQYHVIEGKQITAGDAVGKVIDVDTASGDRLSLDGTGAKILLVPQQAAQGQQQSSQGPGQQGDVQTEVAEESGMPTSEHQQQVLAAEPATEERQTAQDGDMPSSPHQEQVLRDAPAAEQQGAQAGMEPAQTAEESGMPSSPHQEQVLRDEPAAEQQDAQAGTEPTQTAEESGMPSSPHQEQVLRGQQGGREAPGILREARVVEPDIEADNGVIHAVDALLVPQSMLSTLENAGAASQGEPSSTPQSGDEQG
jgi:uncharacterized surface protein with fasciclin (FAS1) repeats